MINQKRDPLLGNDCLYYYIHHFSVSVNKIDSFPLIFHLTRRIIIILCVGHIFYMKCRETKKILQVEIGCPEAKPRMQIPVFFGKSPNENGITKEMGKAMKDTGQSRERS